MINICPRNKMKNKFAFKVVNCDIRFLSFALLLLLQEKCYYLIPFSWFYVVNGNQQQIVMVLISISSFFLMLLMHKIKQTKFAFIALSVFFCCYIAAFAHSVNTNRQSILDIFISSNYFLMIFAFPLVFFVIREKGIISFLKEIIFLSFINVIVCWLQYIGAGFGFIFTKMNLEGSRFGALRIWDMSETLTCVGVIASFALFLYMETKERYMYLFIYILGLLGNVFVSKGRIVLIGILLPSIFIALYKFKRNAISFFIVFIAILILLWTIPSTSIGKMYFSSFGQVETDTASIRMREYNYYWKQIYSNPIWGGGFIRDNGDSASIILRGPTAQYSRTDVGLIGVWNTIGLSGILWFLLVHVRFLYVLLNRWSYFSSFDRSILVSLLVFSIVLMPTMAMFSPFSITTFIIIFAIFENYALKEGKDESTVD